MTAGSRARVSARDLMPDLWFERGETGVMRLPDHRVGGHG